MSVHPEAPIQARVVNAMQKTMEARSMLESATIELGSEPPDPSDPHFREAWEALLEARGELERSVGRMASVVAALARRAGHA